MALEEIKSNRPLVLYGTLAGALPFLGSALALQLGLLSSEPFVSYSVIVLSFLCGVLWWHGLVDARKADQKSAEQPHLTTLPMALALPAAAWLVLFFPTLIAVLLLGCGYLALWVWEMLFMRGVYRKRYLLLRTLMTAVVVLTHFWVLTILS